MRALLDRWPRLRGPVSRLDSVGLALRLEWLYRVTRTPAVLIFQMGKVGSSSVAASFPTERYPVALQTHHLDRAQIAEMSALQRARGNPVRRHYYRASVAATRIIEPGRPYKLITLVREPISQSISRFFHSLDEYTGAPADGIAHSQDELQAAFVEQRAQLNRGYWFEREFEPALGVDVYAHAFPHERGCQTLASEHGEILILRLELADPAKEDAIREFLDDPSFRLRSANVAAAKEYGASYADFTRRLVLPAAVVDSLLDGRYARHFYSDTERDEIRASWAVARTPLLP